LPWVILRPTAVYGPREKDIFIVLQLVKKGLEPYIGRNSQWLSFIYVKDLVQITFDALKSSHVHTTYNISDGKKYNRYALADITKRILKKKALRLHLPMPIVNLVAAVMEIWYRNKASLPALNKEKLTELTAENWHCSIKKAESELSFQPAYDLEKGLTETLQWYLKNKWI
ncbi:MAG: NAD(P)-dependent oxidoreductase, partial [Bacteroidota bacterium]|nr:NAD(P)-dependent oxidoreductase [Bacteroidota bacterium]